MTSPTSFSLPSSAATAGPTPAPLHDIVGPFSFFGWTPQEISCLLFLLLALGGLVIWGFQKWHQKPRLSPTERALEALSHMKKEVMMGTDAEFGMAVSTLLRAYLGTVFLLAAPRQTTEEFLASLQNHTRFTPAEQESLGSFLTHSDFLKFAHGQATESDRLSLIQAAETFIQAGSTPEIKSPSTQKKTTP